MKVILDVFQFVKVIAIIALALSFKCWKKDQLLNSLVRLISSVYIILCDAVLLNMKAESGTIVTLISVFLTIFALIQIVKNSNVFIEPDNITKRVSGKQVTRFKTKGHSKTVVQEDNDEEFTEPVSYEEENTNYVPLYGRNHNDEVPQKACEENEEKKIESDIDWSMLEEILKE